MMRFVPLSLSPPSLPLFLLVLLTGAANAQLCEEQKLRPIQASAPATSTFGEAVDLDGDWCVVGASQLNVSGVANVGGAFVFLLDDTDPLGLRWQHVDLLGISPAQANSQFGQAVAISGDTIVVGEPQRDDLMPLALKASGAAYTFVRAGTTWSGPTKHSTTPQDQEQLGGAVAIDGDLMVAGAIGSLSAGNNVGSVYVFERTTSWGSSPAAQVFAQAPANADSFGASVAIDESEEILVVGATSGEKAPFPAPQNTGVVHVFAGAGASSWTQVEEIEASPIPQSLAQFGCSISLAYPRMVVGACQHDVIGLAGSDHGAAYVYAKNGTTWTQEAMLQAYDDSGTATGNDGEKFGRSVSIEGDTIVVGTLDGEAVYVFDRTGTTWNARTPIVTSENTSTSASPPTAAGFGRAVAQSGVRAVAGAPLDDSASAVESGAAYVFAPFDEVEVFYGVPEPTGFNPACPASTLSTTGVPSMTDPNPYMIIANDVPENLNGSGNGCGVGGTFLWGINGRASMNYGQGKLLVEDWMRVVFEWEITGTPPCSTACGKSISFDFNSLIQSGDFPTELFVGQRVNAQWIANHAAEGPGTNLKETTDAVEFVVCP